MEKLDTMQWTLISLRTRRHEDLMLFKIIMVTKIIIVLLELTENQHGK